MSRHGRFFRTKWALYGILGAVLISIYTAHIALAHTELIATEPPAGTAVDADVLTEIRLQFSAPPAPGSTFAVFNDAFEELPVVVNIDDEHPTDLVAPAPAVLEPGRYTVQWLIVSADGHSQTGSFNFTIGGNQMELILAAEEVAAFNPPGWAGWLMVFLALGTPAMLWYWMKNSK